MAETKTTAGKIYYEDQGEGSPIVFIHGNYGSSRWWKPILGKIPNHRTIALDLPCFGRSAKPETDHRISTYAKYLKEFTDNLDLEKIDLVGHSLGGGVALKYAIQNPEKVNKLVLISPPPADGMGFSFIYRLLFKIVKRSEKIVKHFFNKLVSEQNSLYNELWQDAKKMKKSALQGHVDALEEYNVVKELPNLDPELYIIRGENDSLVDNEDLKDYREYAEDYIVMENVGHAPFIDSTNQFIELLENLLKN